MLVFNGWTNKLDFYAALWATFCCVTYKEFKIFVFAFSSLLKYTSQSAHDYLLFLNFFSRLFQKSSGSIVVLTGDSRVTSKALSRYFDLGFIGCAFHCFNFVVKELLLEQKRTIEAINAIVKTFWQRWRWAAHRDSITFPPVVQNIKMVANV